MGKRVEKLSLGITQEYNAENRMKYWDSTKAKNAYKDAAFGGKQTMRDIETGELLHRHQTAAQNKYHMRNKHGEVTSAEWAKHSAEADHVIALEEIHRAAKNNPFLSDADLKEIANLPENMQILSKQVNTSKGAKSGLELSVEQIRQGNISNGLREASTTLRSGAVVHSKLATRSVKNAGNLVAATAIDAGEFAVGQVSEFFADPHVQELNEAGAIAAKDAAIYAGTMTIVRNVIAVIREEKEAEKAAKDVIVTTATASAAAYASGAVKKGIEHQFGDTLSGEMGIIATGAIEISKQMLSCAAGEIDTEQMLKNVAETSVYLLAGYAGKQIGAVIGSVTGPSGAIVGSIVGEMITTAVCTEIIGSLKYDEAFKKQNAKIKNFCSNAEQEIRSSQERLNIIINQENYALLETTDEGFRLITEGAWNNDMEIIEEGILRIGAKFNMNKEYLEEGTLTLDNLFSNTENTLVFT